MTSCFAESVVTRLAAMGRGAPKLVGQTQDDEDFGNATATIEVDDLKLHVVNDRGLWTVDVVFCGSDPPATSEHPAFDGSLHGEDGPLCPVETLAVALGWLPMADLVEHYGLDGGGWEPDAGPPPGPYLDFDGAVTLLQEHWDEFRAAARSPAVKSRAGDLEARLQERLAAQLT